MSLHVVGTLSAFNSERAEKFQGSTRMALWAKKFGIEVGPENSYFSFLAVVAGEAWEGLWAGASYR